MATVPEPTTRIARYAVSCLPPEHPAYRHFVLWVVWRGGDHWAVTDGVLLLGTDGEWDYDSGEARSDPQWVARHFLHQDAALALAREHAKTMNVNGHTLAQILGLASP